MGAKLARGQASPGPAPTDCFRELHPRKAHSPQDNGWPLHFPSGIGPNPKLGTCGVALSGCSNQNRRFPVYKSESTREGSRGRRSQGTWRAAGGGAQTGCALTWSPRPGWQHPHCQSPFRPDPSATLCLACARRGAGSYHPQALCPSLNECHSTFSAPLRCCCSFVHAGAWVETPVSAGTKGGGVYPPTPGHDPTVQASSFPEAALQGCPPQRCLPGAATAQPTGNKCSGHRGLRTADCGRAAGHAACQPRPEPEGPPQLWTDGRTGASSLCPPGW